MSVLKEFKQGYFPDVWLENGAIEHINEWVSGVRRTKVPYTTSRYVSKTFWSITPSNELPMSKKKKKVREEEEWIYSQIIKREYKDGIFRFACLVQTKLPEIPHKGTFNQWRPGLKTVLYPEDCEYIGYRLNSNGFGNKRDDPQSPFKHKTLDEAYDACIAQEEAEKRFILSAYATHQSDGQVL